MSIFLQELPEELNDKVLEYAGKIKMRNGKYMKQIPKEDPRYDILRTIPSKEGKVCMIYSQMCYISRVIKNGKTIICYIENQTLHGQNHPQGEISISHHIESRMYSHVLGYKYPACFAPSIDSNNKKRWIPYFPENYD